MKTDIRTITTLDPDALNPAAIRVRLRALSAERRTRLRSASIAGRGSA